MTLADTLKLLDDDELERMKTRSYIRAAREWQESRAPGLSNTVRNMLSNSAFSEEQFYNACLREESERKEAAREQAVLA